MVQAVIFDMDGVLIDSEPLWKVAEKKAFRKIGMDMTTEMCNLTMGYRTNEVIDYWYLRNPWKGKSKQEVEQDLINTVIAEIIAEGKIMPGVLQALELISGKGIQIALASSSAMRIIDVVVDKLNIRKFFKVIRSAEKEQYGKPHPAVFLAAAKELQVDPLNCVVIEDSVNGVVAGKAAKMFVVAVPDPSLAADKRFAIADVKLGSLEQFSFDIFLQG